MRVVKFNDLQWVWTADGGCLTQSPDEDLTDEFKRVVEELIADGFFDYVYFL